MKIEQHSQPTPEFTVVSALNSIKEGECLRVSTPREYRSALGQMTGIGKKRKIRFGSKVDGDDVLVFIKP